MFSGYLAYILYPTFAKENFFNFAKLMIICKIATPKTYVYYINTPTM